MDFFKKPSASEIAKQLIGREVTPLVQTHEPDHKHEWEMLSKTQAPARKDIPQNLSSLDKDLADRILFGVTVFLWECLVCRSLRKETILGSDLSQLDELIDKADRFGPQYIQRVDGTTFVLGKYNQPQVGAVPMR